MDHPSVLRVVVSFEWYGKSNPHVIPANSGIHSPHFTECDFCKLDSRLRGNGGGLVSEPIDTTTWVAHTKPLMYASLPRASLSSMVDYENINFSANQPLNQGSLRLLSPWLGQNVTLLSALLNATNQKLLERTQRFVANK